MIVETRELFFTNSALSKAIAWYQKVPNQTDLPLGIVTMVTPKPGGGLIVLVQQSGASKAREIPFSANKTLGVLLLFCRRQKIPIPREAVKDIVVADDGLILVIRGETLTVAPPI
jgi:hypothetical protein